jgi:hypothetical protein
MSYLLELARPRARRASAKRARVDERTRLNLLGYYGDAYVRVYVEDTTARPREPRITLTIADCTNEIHLEFSLCDHGYRANSIHKIDTLLGALRRFRVALVAEAELAARRENTDN